MKILDSIVEWIAEQIVNLLDLLNASILGALGCDTSVFLRYFPAAETLYEVFVAIAIGFILLNLVWQLLRNFGLVMGSEAEHPLKLLLRSAFFIFPVFYSDDIVSLVLKIGGTPYNWILSQDLPPIDFVRLDAVLLVVIGVMANGSVTLIALILLIMLSVNYIKMLFEAGERYILLCVIVFTSPIAFAMGASQSTGSIFKSWCRMLGGQIFLLIMNVWCLRLFTNMIGTFLVNPLSL